MKTVAIIVAGGSGKRIEGNLPKQFLMLDGKPILAHTIEKFEKCDLVDEIILVVPERYLDYCSQAIVDKFGFGKIRRITCGGEERHDSVYSGLIVCHENTSIVSIHDGVRPLVAPEIVAGSIQLCRQKKAVIVAVRAKDTIKRVESGLVTATLDRRELWLVQTPQVFEYKLIMEAHKMAREDNFIGTDDSALVERLGCEVVVLEGKYENIKITTAEDLLIAEKLLKTKRGV